MSVIDLTGHKYGNLTVMKRYGRNSSNKITWLCKCDCGEESIVAGNTLRSGLTKSCGCLKHERRAENLTGKKFNRWTVLKRCKENKLKAPLWECICKCGEKGRLTSQQLKEGISKSCGCYKNEVLIRRNKKNSTHNKTNTRLYRIWGNMKGRCNNELDKDYKNYGNRGIMVCDVWELDFEMFYEWAISNGYKENLTLDRIDVNGNYEPSNCRWASVKKQQRNTRRNYLITIKGVTKTAIEWEEESGISSKTIIYRHKNNWPEDKLLVEPDRGNKYGNK